MMMISAAAFLAAAVLFGAPVPQDPAPVRLETIAPAADLDTLTLVMSGTDHAVVRFGSSEAGAGLLIVKTGDRIGRTAAIVREIDPGRLVLDELTRDKDGRPRRAQIVLREGEPGGRRYMRDPGLDAPTGVRPDVLGRGGKPTGVKKPGKHP